MVVGGCGGVGVVTKNNHGNGDMVNYSETPLTFCDHHILFEVGRAGGNS